MRGLYLYRNGKSRSHGHDFKSHRELSTQPIAKLYICWNIFYKLKSVPFLKLKLYDGRPQPLKSTTVLIYRYWHTATPTLVFIRQSHYRFSYL